MALSTLQFRFAVIYRESFKRSFSALPASGTLINRNSNKSLETRNVNPQILPKTFPSGYNQPSVCRYFSSDSSDISNPRKRSLPQLMDFPEIVWPSVLKTIKNWILVNFIIRPYFDREFTVPDFVAGAKQALQVMEVWAIGGGLTSFVSAFAGCFRKTSRRRHSCPKWPRL